MSSHSSDILPLDISPDSKQNKSNREHGGHVHSDLEDQEIRLDNFRELRIESPDSALKAYQDIFDPTLKAY
jgi:hypothetical protein